MRIDEWLTLANADLAQTGVESHRIEAEILAAHALGLERSAILAHPEMDRGDTADALLARRLTGEPLAYILGYREFFGRRFVVNPHVLIPRQETETLIEAWIEFGSRFQSRAAVLDLGAGSGCLGITLKLERPDLQVTLSDISADALHVARANALALKADVRIVQGDLFKNLGGERFDAIVTNPPYIGIGETLPLEITRFEPSIAIYAGPEGLEFYKSLAAQAPGHLRFGGMLFTEVGYSQSNEVQALFHASAWRLERIFRDLGGVERILAYSVLEQPDALLP